MQAVCRAIARDTDTNGARCIDGQQHTGRAYEGKVQMIIGEAKEADVQRACLDYLDAKRIMYIRLNAGDSFRPGANGKLYKVRGASKGTSDILVLAHTEDREPDTKAVFITPRPLFIEFKRIGAKQNADQQAFQQMVEAVKYEYHIIRSIDELLEVLK